MRFVVFMAVLGGCQCLQPVGEDVDGGVPRDAGSDAGAIVECTTAGDCTLPIPTPKCWNGPAMARSCVDRRCVYECGSTARTCRSSNGTCLNCDGGTTTCGASCSGVFDGETGRLYRDCGNDSMTVGGFTIRYAQGATCNFVFTTDAGVRGALDLHDGTSVAQISTEPGLNCTVLGLATALNRTLLGCGQCVYLLESP